MNRPGHLPTQSPSEARAERSTMPVYRLVIGLGLLALALRLLYVFQIERSPFAHILLGDAAAYDQWARQIAAGDWIGHEVFYQAPLYPYCLALVHLTMGPSVLAVRLVQAGLGAIACVMLAGAGAFWFNRRTGLVAGLLLAVYPPAIFFDGLVQKASLDLLLTCALLLVVGWARPERWWHWLVAGAVAGLLALNRENALALAPVLMGWFAVKTGKSGWRRLVAGEAALLLGLGLVLAPVAARNAAIGGEFHLTTSQFGPNFYIGNNPGATGRYRPLRFGRGVAESERTDATELAETAVGRKLTPGEVSAYWRNRALHYIRTEPGPWLALMGRKVLLLINRVEITDTEDEYTWADESGLLHALVGRWHFGLAASLAVAGMAITWPRLGRLWPLYAILSVYALSVVLFYVFARYRVPLVPVLLLFAAAALVAPWRRLLQGKSYGRVAAAAVLATGLFALTTRDLVSVTGMRALTMLNFSSYLATHGEMAPAAKQFARLVELNPRWADARFDLALALAQLGRSKEAYEQAQIAVQLSPDAEAPKLLLKQIEAGLGRARSPSN